MQKRILILSLSTIFAITPFKGYIKHEGGYYGSYQYRYVYAEGQYLDGLMNGEWKFYTDSTKQNIIAKGNFLEGNTSNPSKDGIPRHGRNGLWEHYYTKNLNNWNTQKSMKNPLRATQYWNNGKLNGKSTSYFKDGKIAIESYYKNGKRNGKRKEWYQGGYMYTKLYRITNYIDGRTDSDKIYDYTNTNISISSSYVDEIKTDTIYSSNHKKKLFIRQLKNEKYHGDFIAYHLNGTIWIKGQFNNGFIDGKWEEFSNQGLSLAKMNYNNGKAIIENGYNQKIYNKEGDLIYSYNFIDGKRYGETIELLYNVPNIIHKFELNSRLINRYHQRHFNTMDMEHPNHTKYGRFNINLIPYLNPYQRQHQYRIDNRQFIGFTQRLNYIQPNHKIIGYGEYIDNKRIGEWVWKTTDKKIILTGQYNTVGHPIGQWKEMDIKDSSNFIITQYDDNGKIKSTSKNIKTYLKK